MNPSVSLDAKAKRYAGNLATVSSCCGVTGETVLADSAVIMIFAAALGASDMLSLISTSMLPFFNGLFILPGAFLAVKVWVIMTVYSKRKGMKLKAWLYMFLYRKSLPAF